MKILQRKFLQKILINKQAGGKEEEYVDDVPFKDVALFVLALIIPSFIKRHMKYVPGKDLYSLNHYTFTYSLIIGSTTENTKAFKTYDVFYECLYRYSHKRLESALGIPSVSWVFKIFLNGGVFDNLLKNDSTLSKNQEAYEEAKQEFLNIIN